MDFWSKNNVPKGSILIWSGAIVDIPAGWALCDGTNGTPNMKDKFVVCAGDVLSVDDVGGDTAHTHNASGTMASDSLDGGDEILNSEPMGEWTHDLVSNNVIVSIAAVQLRPPYYCKAYIMKL